MPDSIASANALDRSATGPLVLPAWVKVFTYMDKKVQGFKMHPTGFIFGHELAVSA